MRSQRVEIYNLFFSTRWKDFEKVR